AGRMEGHVASGAYAGIAWRIGTASDIVHEGRVGAAREDALWRIYSMTKPIVSVAAMQLVEDCRAPLHARIRRWLPEFEVPVVLDPSGARTPAREPIALIHLLSHMSGLSYGFLSDAAGRLYAEAGILADDREPLREVVRRVGALPLAGHPGERWRYSVATDVLGALIEVEEGRSLPDVLRARIFEPLDMSDTGFFVPQVDRHRLVEVRGTPLPPALPAVPPLGLDAVHPVDLPGFARGGHGLISSVEDYARFAAALLRTAQGDADGPVAPRTLAAMTTNQLGEAQLPMVTSLPFDSESPGFGGFGFGLGFSVDLGARGRRLLGSPGGFGWAGAADTWFVVDPIAGFYAVFMSQSTDRAGASYDFQTLLHAAVH
ncbi:MAG: serine hydrolase domain-containing protein, partial [Pseudomonadota bacterium]